MELKTPTPCFLFSSKKRPKNLLTDVEVTTLNENMQVIYESFQNWLGVTCCLVGARIAIHWSEKPPSILSGCRTHCERIQRWGDGGVEVGHAESYWTQRLVWSDHASYVHILDYQVIWWYLIGTSDRLYVNAPSQPALKKGSWHQERSVLVSNKVECSFLPLLG